MPQRMKVPCGYQGCPELIESNTGGYCEKHLKQREKAYDQLRSSARERGYTTQWDHARKRYLAEHPLCAMCEEEGIVEAATLVDHKIPHEGNHDLFWDESNWQSLCIHHHALKTAKEKGITYMHKPKVYLICGPPASGKTTYVMEHMQYGDIVFDFDKIMVALTNCKPHDRPKGTYPFLWAIREAILKQCEQDCDIRAVWIISSSPEVSKRQEIRVRLNAEVIMIPIEASICRARASKDESRIDRLDEWYQAIDSWWQRYQPDAQDAIVESRP